MYRTYAWISSVPCQTSHTIINIFALEKDSASSLTETVISTSSTIPFVPEIPLQTLEGQTLDEDASRTYAKRMHVEKEHGHVRVKRLETKPRGDRLFYSCAQAQAE